MRWISGIALVACSFRPLPGAVTGGDGSSSPGGSDATEPPGIDAPPDGPDITTGLIAYYPMETIATKTTPDASGNNHTATCTACPSLTAGQVGSGFHFDGTQRFDVDDDAFETTTGYTIAMWVRFTQLGGSFNCPAGKVFGTGIIDSWELCWDGGSKKWDYVTAPNGATLEQLEPSTGPTANTWFHAAMTWDGTTKTLWIDGAPVKSATAAVVYDNHPLTFGGDIDNGNLSSTLVGDMDELRVYDHALGSAQIAVLATP